MKYALLTFGCRVNQADSLRLEEDLRARGDVEASSAEAELVIVNTCSVTATADQGARQSIRRIARNNPSARIVVTGCYATRRPEELSALPGVVRVVANTDKRRIIPLLEAAGELTTAERFGEGPGPCGSPLEPGVAGRTAFTLCVQSGCDEACSYCIIPSTRGAGRSLRVDGALSEAGRAARAGFKEIVLTGVHLGSYGRDLMPGTTLAELAWALLRLEADVTFRISSLEPMDCGPALIALIASSGGRIAPHFHLPLQHASDSVLSRMRRPYTLDRYRRLIGSILHALPHASIGTDIIVGFPGETDEDFAATLSYLPDSGLSHLHVFPYSDRSGTVASGLPDKVPGPVVRERGLRIRQIGAELSARFRASQVGSIRPGLTLEDGTLVVTDNYLKLRIAPGLARNTRVRVRVGQEGGSVVG